MSETLPNDGKVDAIFQSEWRFGYFQMTQVQIDALFKMSQGVYCKYLVRFLDPGKWGHICRAKLTAIPKRLISVLVSDANFPKLGTWQVMPLRIGTWQIICSSLCACVREYNPHPQWKKPFSELTNTRPAARADERLYWRRTRRNRRNGALSPFSRGKKVIGH